MIPVDDMEAIITPITRREDDASTRQLAHHHNEQMKKILQNFDNSLERVKKAVK
jgi:hypothetical protein